MATKISKTARASSGKVKPKFHKPCPACGGDLVATKVVSNFIKPKGMYWICQCGYRAKIQH